MDIVSFSGRINRAPWLLTQLATLVFMTPLFVAGFVPEELRGFVVFLGLFSIPILWVNMATGTRRLHDRDKSGGVVGDFLHPAIHP